MDLERILAPTLDLGAEWSVSIRSDDEPTATLEHRPSALLRTASVAKVFVLMELTDRLNRGELDPAQLIYRSDASAVHDSGFWQAMRADALPLSDVALLVGAVSDNWATNVLIHRLGLDRVQARAAAEAPGGSMLHDRVRDERPSDLPETLSTGCAGDWSAIMQRLHREGGPALGWLARNTDLSMVAAAFDLDPLAHDALWNKTGSDPGVLAEVGVFATPSAVVSYAVVCNWPPAEMRIRPLVRSAMRQIDEGIAAAR